MTTEINISRSSPLPPQTPSSNNESQLDPRVVDLQRRLDGLLAASQERLRAEEARNHRMEEQDRRAAESNRMLEEYNQRAAETDKELRHLSETQEEVGRLLVTYIAKVEENNANWERAFSNIASIARRILNPIAVLRNGANALRFQLPLQLQDTPLPGTVLAEDVDPPAAPVLAEDVAPLPESEPDPIQQTSTEEKKKRPRIMNMCLGCIARKGRDFYNMVRSVCQWVTQKIRPATLRGNVKND